MIHHESPLIHPSYQAKMVTLPTKPCVTPQIGSLPCIEDGYVPRRPPRPDASRAPNVAECQGNGWKSRRKQPQQNNEKVPWKWRFILETSWGWAKGKVWVIPMKSPERKHPVFKIPQIVCLSWPHWRSLLELSQRMYNSASNPILLSEVSITSWLLQKSVQYVQGNGNNTKALSIFEYYFTVHWYLPYWTKRCCPMTCSNTMTRWRNTELLQCHGFWHQNKRKLRP